MNNIFLSHQISQQYFQSWLISQTNSSEQGVEQGVAKCYPWLMLLCLVQISHLVQCFLDLHVLFQGRLKKKCCFREGAISMLSGSLYNSTCRVAVICLPCIVVASVSFIWWICDVMCTAVEVLKQWHGMCWHCEVAAKVVGLSSDFGSWSLISSVMLCDK